MKASGLPKIRRESALAWAEVLFALTVIAILIFLTLPVIIVPGGLVRGPMTQTLSNLRQLHLATQMMAQDGVTMSDPSRGWPGDIGGTFSNWARQLVPKYLSTNDFCKLSSAPGVRMPEGAIPTWDQAAFRIYAVRENSSNTTVLLTSANFTNTPRGGTPLSRKALPYGNTGFVVFRKGGDGAILRKDQVTKTNIIGEYAPLCR